MTSRLFSGTPLSQFAGRLGHATQAGAKPISQQPRQPAATTSEQPVTKATPEPSRALAKPEPAHRAYVPLPAANGQLRLVPIQRLAQGGKWRVEAMRSYGEPVLYWFTRGQGRLTVGGITRGYGAHNAVLVPAGMMHGFEAGPQSIGTALFFGSDCTADLPADPLHLRIRDAHPQAELSMLLENIQRELESGRAGHDRAARLHLGLLAVWLERHASEAEAAAPDAYRKLARRYTDLLERDYRSGQSVTDYARALGVTSTHLTRVCNKTCGRPASDLLRDRVIFEARRMLAETRLPITRISRDLGFTSPAYFTRAFQHRTGKTPSAFRRAP